MKRSVSFAILVSPASALAHDGHGLDAIAHEIFHYGWVFAIPVVLYLLLRRPEKRSRSTDD